MKTCLHKHAKYIYIYMYMYTQEIVTFVTDQKSMFDQKL